MSAYLFDGPGRRFSLVFLLAILLAPEPAAAQGLKIVSPDPIEVGVVEGRGALEVDVLVPSGTKFSGLTLTPAVSLGGSLPETAVTWSPVGPPAPFGADALHKGILRVEARGLVVPGIAYKGYLLAPGLTTTPYTLQDRGSATLTFPSDPLSFTWLAGQDPTLSLALTNDGFVPVTITGVTATIRDAATGRQFNGPVSVLADTPLTIGPRGHDVLRMAAPSPPFAGTYTGSLVIGYNANGRATVPFTLITRGPTPGAHHWVPFVLFALVLVVACLLAFLMESWFGSGGGLARAQAIVSLADVERGLAESLQTLKTMISNAAGAGKTLALPVTIRNIERTSELARESRLSRDPALDLPGVLGQVRSGQLAAAALIRDLRAWQGISAASLAVACPAIEAVAWPTDQPTLNQYRLAVRAALDAALDADAAAALAAGPAPAPAPAQVALGDIDTHSIATYRRRIFAMTQLHRATVAIVVLVSAYATFYAPKPAFGTGMDYIALFLWGLGLTQAGAQIVARARTAGH